MNLALNLVFATALSLPLAGHADEYKTVQYDKSTLTFSFKQMGVGMNGNFKKFDARVDFNPANLTGSQAQFDLDVASIDVGSDEGNDAVVGKQWFDVKAFPKARFTSNAIKSLGGNRYEASGALTIKGRTKIITTPATMTVSGKTASFDGAFAIQRTDYGIGEGAWSSVDIVANEIQIKFHLLASTNAAN
jgi:polyisoprenoid-binding protein YceI